MHDGYTISGGRAELDRLSRQASVMADATLAFLVRIGLAEGSACLDVGCGEGQVAVAAAGIAGKGGRVVGIDVDPDVLVAARSATEHAGVAVDFAVADASEPFADGAFDLVFARLVLSHLVDPAAAVRAMRDAVRPGGVVAVEDLLTGTLYATPPRSVLDELQSVYAATVRAGGGDPTIGPRLRAILAASGLVDVTESVVVNPMTSIPQKRFLVELMENMRPAIAASGTATQHEIDDIVAGTERAAREPGTVFYQARMYQVSGRRPGGPGAEAGPGTLAGPTPMSR